MAPGGAEREERKWERKAPPPPEEASQPLRGWFQSTDTNRQIQTHTDRFRHTHRNPHAQRASSLGHPPPTLRQLPCLLVEAILGLPLPSLGYGQCHPTHPWSIEGMSSWMGQPLSLGHCTFPEKGYERA